MKKNSILIIHGPNMNLISHRAANAKNRITLDKINKCLRKEAQLAGYHLKVLQTNEEGYAATNIQRQHNKITGIIIFPGPWQKSAHTIKDTLEILQIPFVTVSTGEEADILNGIENINEPDLLKGCRQAVVKLANSI